MNENPSEAVVAKEYIMPETEPNDVVKPSSENVRRMGRAYEKILGSRASGKDEPVKDGLGHVPKVSATHKRLFREKKMFERKLCANARDKNGKCLRRGLDIDALFVELLQKRGYLFRRATEDEERDSHFHFVMRPSFDLVMTARENGKTICTDEIIVAVRPMSRITGDDAVPQDELLFVEIHGSSERDKGWLYGGKSQWVAIEMRDRFLIADRSKLQSFVDTRVDPTDRAKYPQQAI